MNSTSKFALKTTLKGLVVGVLSVAAIASVATQAQAQTASAAPALTGVYVGGTVGSTSITDLGSKVGFGGYVCLKLD